jgi:hypothetical protein
MRGEIGTEETVRAFTLAGVSGPATIWPKPSTAQRYTEWIDLAQKKLGIQPDQPLG